MLLAAFLTAALTGCAPSGSRKACDVEVLEPMVSLDDASLIDGLALAICDHPPAEHVMHVTVEWYRDGQWTAVPGIYGRDYTECRDIPTPGSSVPCSHLIACIDGTYRTSVSILGSGVSGPFSFAPPEKPQAAITCPRL